MAAKFSSNALFDSCPVMTAQNLGAIELHAQRSPFYHSRRKAGNPKRLALCQRRCSAPRRLRSQPVRPAAEQLQSIGPLRQTIGAVEHHLLGVTLIYQPANQEARDPVRCNTAPQIVAYPNREEGARVIVKPSGIV
jgi:hypothetical protein